jgi:hypothetical protein
MAAEIEITRGSLIVRVQGMDRVWALTSELKIPLAHVGGAERDEEEARRWWHGIRAPGTSLPGVLTAGTFYQHGERIFWDVHRPEKAVAILLHDERYARLVIEVEDPDAVIASIRAATAAAAQSRRPDEPSGLGQTTASSEPPE